MKYILPAILAVFLLAGCSDLEFGAPRATLAAVIVAYPPDLQPLKPALNACAAAHPELAIVSNETPARSLDFDTNDLVFSLGLGMGTPPFAAEIAQDQLMVIVNPDNKINEISTDNLQAIFTGRKASWNDIQGAAGGEVKVWAYATGDLSRGIFDAAVLSGQNLSPKAQLAPDPAAMLKSVSADKQAIGYIPGAWLAGGDTPPNVRIVKLDSSLEFALRQPVLALAGADPQGATRVVLACLQSEQGAAEIKKIYK